MLAMNRLARARAVVLVGAIACGSSSSTGVGRPGDAGSGPLAEGGGSASGGSSGASGGSSGASGSGASNDAGFADSGVLPSGRSFPDTWSSIAILADQFPSGLTSAQQQFVATHFVGTEKQVLSDTRALRAYNPNFLVLHYHLAMWQSAPNVTFIVDGKTWGNDFPTVTQNEPWFWHNTSNQRVTASDGKYLMNISAPGFDGYWAQSLAQQVAAGEYDGIMFDSASPALLQGWCGGSGANQDPRLAGTAAHDTSFAELGNKTWIEAWQNWISALDGALAAKGTRCFRTTVRSSPAGTPPITGSRLACFPKDSPIAP